MHSPLDQSPKGQQQVQPGALFPTQDAPNPTTHQRDSHITTPTSIQTALGGNPATSNPTGHTTDHPRVITTMATTNRMNVTCGQSENELPSYINNNCPLTNNIDVNIVGLNVCGLKSKLKYNALQKFANENDYDILCLSETRTDHIDLAGTSLENYACFVKEKSINTHRNGGVHGLCMMVKDKFAAHAQLLTDIQSPYVLWVKFHKEAFGFGCILGSAYLPGENSIHKDNEMYDTIANDILNLKNAPLQSGIVTLKLLVLMKKCVP